MVWQLQALWWSDRHRSTSVWLVGERQGAALVNQNCLVWLVIHSLASQHGKRTASYICCSMSCSRARIK